MILKAQTHRDIVTQREQRIEIARKGEKTEFLCRVMGLPGLSHAEGNE